MQDNRGRQILTLSLICGAMAFGMFLAGGTQLVPVSYASPEPARSVTLATPATNGLPNLADLAQAVSPAVVAIQATTIETRNQQRADPFEFFFGPRGQRPNNRQQPNGRQPEERRSDSAGSGFVISPDGLVVTNHHVIDGASGLTVRLNGREYDAVVQGDDPATDLALLKIEADEDLPFLDLGDSESLRVGEWIMVIGSPLRLNNSVSVGVVSAKGRSINITPDSGLENFIQTDAAINFGNSGGPLVDLQGRVIGIATAINFGAENIGFAVPVETLQTILPQLRDSGSVRRGYLGVGIADLDFDTAEAFGLDGTDGALVNNVRPDSPSKKAGLMHGDVILGVDGKKIRNNRELIDYIASKQPSSVVELEVFRQGKKMMKEVKLGERPGTADAEQEPEEEEKEGRIEWLGIDYRDISSALRENHGLSDEVDGVWVSNVAPTSPLFERNIRPGDIITEVNGQAITSVGDFEEAVESVQTGGFVRLYVHRFDPRTGVGNGFFAIVRAP